ncbi:uncharacterized protein KY384_005500 [Bacidia gigantensis]|uniref:uncharacterized protein n=1 Tax=Bacidia gigantensis TaxID=2732470 RepID=UPI001D048A5D|nr:uncharacterized protein KY384_005500 [Bacidia gigantensis]KAG8530018.1 hypothetical protein KY384_005500 [Bacidia gigantensis]
MTSLPEEKHNTSHSSSSISKHYHAHYEAHKIIIMIMIINVSRESKISGERTLHFLLCVASDNM